jgi:hypothetical protein
LASLPATPEKSKGELSASGYAFAGLEVNLETARATEGKMGQWRKMLLTTGVNLLLTIAILLFSNRSYSSMWDGGDLGADEAKAESPIVAEARSIKEKDICSYCHPSGQAIDSTGDSFHHCRGAGSRHTKEGATNLAASVSNVSDAAVEPIQESFHLVLKRR